MADKRNPKTTKQKSLDAAGDYYIDNNCNKSDVKESYLSMKREQVPKMYVTYKTVNEFYSIIIMNLPFLCVGTVNNRYYAVIQRNKGEENMYGIEIEYKYFETTSQTRAEQL